MLSKEQTLCLLTWLIWPAHNLGDLRSLWVFFSHRHHGHLPARQRDFSLTVQSAVVHQGELTGGVFRTGPSLLLAPSLSGTFFVQCSDGISIKSGLLSVRSRSNSRDTAVYMLPTGRGSAGREHFRAEQDHGGKAGASPSSARLGWQRQWSSC